LIERERNELIKNLVSFGLTPVQAQAYVTLLRFPSATAKSISTSSDLNRVDTYRALRHLKKFGIVEEKLGNPTQFVAADPDQALDILIALKLRSVDQLRTSKTDLLTKLQEFKAELGAASTVEKDDTDGEMFLRVMWGEQMFRRVQKVALESKKDIITIFAARVMIIFDQIGIPELEAERRRNGVRIRALTNIIPENLDQASLYSKIVELRHNDLPPSQLRYTIVDGERLILAVGEPPSNNTEGTALWTNNKVLIAALKVDFESVWENSVPAKERINLLLATQSAR